MFKSLKGPRKHSKTMHMYQLPFSSQQSYEKATIIPILQVGKLRNREVKQLA